MLTKVNVLGGNIHAKYCTYVHSTQFIKCNISWLLITKTTQQFANTMNTIAQYHQMLILYTQLTESKFHYVNFIASCPCARWTFPKIVICNPTSRDVAVWNMYNHVIDFIFLLYPSVLFLIVVLSYTLEHTHKLTACENCSFKVWNNILYGRRY